MVAMVNLQGDPGVTYEVQYHTNLNATAGWQTLRFVTADEGGQVSVVDESGKTRFYRTVKVGIASPLAVTLDAEPSWTYLRDSLDAIVASYSVTAGASRMRPVSIKLDFDKRLWLYAKAITILDGSTVLVSKYDLSAADFIELAVGSSYRLNLPLTDFYQVTPNQTQHFAVLLHAYDVEDRPPTTLNITRFEIRATDSATATMDVTAETISSRTFLYKGIVGQVVATLNASTSPARTIQISETAQTDNVLLGRFDLKSQNISGTLRQIVFGLHVEDVAINALFGDVKLNINGHTYSADEIRATSGGAGPNGSSSDGYARFSNMNEVLPADQNVVVSIYGKINQDVNGSTLSGAKASVSLTTSTSPVLMNNPEVGDGAYQPIDVVPTTITASTLTFLSSPAVLSELLATPGSVIVSGGETVGQAVEFSFTVTSNNQPLYFGRGGWGGIGTMMSIGTSLTTSDAVATNPSNVLDDTSGYFVVPANSSRTFTLNGTLVGHDTHGPVGVGIWNISFGTEKSNLNRYQIWYGLEALQLQLIF